jgi:CRISPR/Cas system-associated exonuclease Cas4 (RecB family)
MPEIRLSASLYQRFLACPKSASFSVDPETKNHNKPSTRAALGMVSHELIENSARIPKDWSLEQITLWFETNWEMFVEKQYGELVAKWSPNIVPKPQSWTGYFATRASAKTLVIKNSALLPPKSVSRAEAISENQEEREYSLPLVEKFLVSSDLGIVGKPDFVFLENRKATIYDYKFGNNQEDLEKHKIQMYFYQLLIESVVKVEVGRLAIVASANRVWEVISDRPEIEKLKRDIPRVISALQSGKVAAVPSSQNCRFCPFKAICEPFKNANIEIFPGRPMSITGEVRQVRKIDENFQELVVSSKKGATLEEIRIFGVPTQYALSTGFRVFLSDNLEFRDEKIIGFSWNSRITIQD